MLVGTGGANATRTMGRAASPGAVLAFDLAGFALLYAILRLQAVLPLNSDGIGAMAPDLALNTAVSFVTNTNWQAYSGEVQLSYLSQMAGLTVQNFVSAGSGMAVAAAVVHGFVAPKSDTLGNFWVNMIRSVRWVLLPLSLVLALFLACQGVPQTMLGAVPTTGLEVISRSSPAVPQQRRSQSSSWAPMAAASSA